MKRYVYVPYEDASMEVFANELEKQKKTFHQNAPDKQYKKIGRSLTGKAKPLEVVDDDSRLYVCAHGTESYSGVCVNTEVGSTDKGRYVTGEDFAGVLIAHGLKNKKIEVRLWTCWGAKAGKKKWHGPDTDKTVAHYLYSFALRVACGFKARNYKQIRVVGYMHLVNLQKEVLEKYEGHKQLQKKDNKSSKPISAGHQDEYKVSYEVSHDVVHVI
jgi:hypothetical protein